MKRVSHVLIVVELEMQWQVRFDLSSKQHVIFSVWHILLSHDWLSGFGFLLTHKITSGTVMGNSFVLFKISMEIS